MEKPKKIDHLYLKEKGSPLCGYACGWCFAVLEKKDVYCWNCGCKTTDNGVSYLDGLIESLKEK